MARFLVKTEPSTYSFADLQRDKRTVWDGVSNPVALRNLATIRRGDTVVVYHTGDEKQAVGLAVAVSDAYPDPKLKNPNRAAAEALGGAVHRAPVPAPAQARGRVGANARIHRGDAMCRNIRTLYNFSPPTTDDEVRAASLQFVRKISGFTKPSHANQAAFERAVDDVSRAARTLLGGLTTTAPPKDREVEAAKARLRAAQRFGQAQG